MMRHFISHAPRFGSYKEPRPFLVKQSPYYWWWLALTLNEEYAKLCEQQQRQRASTSSDFPKPQPQMLKLYADWGDVRYNGDRYRAFCDWWRNRVNTNEECGAYLFAEPLRGRWTHLVEDGERAAEYAEHDDWLVIAIPLPQQRRYVDKSINRLLKKHLTTERGKAVVNPAEHSQARYHLAKAVHVARLERALTLYELKHSARGRRMSNAKLADAVGLTTKPSQKRVADESVDATVQKNTVSTLVSRELRLAREMVMHAGVGVFP